jgi:Rha family phage regulatory protein
MVSSLQVAERFGKEHKNVLKAIRALECSDKFREGNFSLSAYESGSGNFAKQQPMFWMTRDGFSFLAMGLHRARRSGHDGKRLASGLSERKIIRK